MTRDEMDAIFVINGMHYQLREEYVSQSTEEIRSEWKGARRRQDPIATKRLSKMLQESQAQDIARALDRIRERNKHQ